MLKTKLLGIFVAFALMITVGGVYATWGYTTSTLSAINHLNNGVDVNINDATTSGAPGSLVVVGGIHNLAFNIVNSGEYVPEIQGTGAIEIQYVKNSGSSVNSVDLKCELYVSSAGEHSKYEGAELFCVRDNQTVVATVTLQMEDVSDTNTWTITAEELLGYFGFTSDSLVIDTIEKYNAFAAAIDASQFNIDISVVIPTT